MNGPFGVALDASAVPLEPVGAGRYTLELARALAAREDVALTVVSRRLDEARWRELGPSAVTVLAAAPDSTPARLVFGERGLSRLVERSGPENLRVLHAPHYTMPRHSSLPVVVTIHDLTFVEHPEWHERSKVIVFRRAIEVAARRADALICVSATTAERLLDRFIVAGEVRVVPHGVDHDRFAPRESEAGADDAVLHRLGLTDRRFVLHVGVIEPRKNLPLLVEAFDALADADAELLLVLAGRDGWGSAALEEALGAARHGNRVLRPGYVADGDVAALLRRAACVAYPSLEEGFGLPALEALACGAPLVTTARTVMAELAGPAALLVGGTDAAELRDALHTAIEGGAAQDARRAEGLARAARYTWAASAGGHLDAFRTVASS